MPYTNSTNNTLYISIYGNATFAGGAIWITVDGFPMFIAQSPLAGGAASTVGIVPAGRTYVVSENAVGAVAITSWIEYR